MKDLKTYALQLLDRLEESEYSLLAWGFVEGHFSREELEQEASDILRDDNAVYDSDELLDCLMNYRLLFEFSRGNDTFYRTRFAEAIRLFTQLRQIFSIKEWATAPRLVSDYRLCLRTRTYPQRAVTRQALLELIQKRYKLGGIEVAVLDRLLEEQPGSEFRLARFQAQSTVHLLSRFADSKSGATIITAGTGTGKTLAFYIPVLLRVAQQMKKTDAWVQIIAVYPRKELLKDQFTNLFRLASRLDSVVHPSVGRNIRIGAYYGDTPFNDSTDDLKKSRWNVTGKGYICPFLRCPNCGSDIVFSEANGERRIRCDSPACGTAISPTDILVSRNQMHQTPPDILLTTTEMLNRQLSSSFSARTFGINQSWQRSPYAFLMDEVHTYDGAHGAHVAHLLRRWRNLVNRPVQFVGLSATLNNPQGFFAQVIGLPLAAVEVIDAGEDDQETHGKEYLLALRGDPISGTSLLSTTIQASMLMARILDQLECPVSDDTIGSRVFAFTDDLDVTNRLFHNLLNAEGRDSNGNEDARQTALASYRSSLYDDAKSERFRHGQYWSICERIGHPPTERLYVGRTSSQDAGVDAACQVVVATSSLELGYDDPFVGAVLQHKAPRNAASFVQRRGRGGRKKGARPWTVVVLSDYGRDRIAFQAYEHLFDPLIEKSNLPIANRHILRIQAVYAFMEWVSLQLRESLGTGSVWADFSGPARHYNVQNRQSVERELVEAILLDEDKRKEMVDYLMNSLRTPEGEVHALLYEPPRGLMTAVLPTLLRLLRSNWENVSCAGDPRYGHQNYPLPDFVPATLFSDLNIPEVQITVPIGKSDELYTTDLPIALAMRIMAPGRVTRRFGYKQKYDTHWVEPIAIEKSGVQDLPIGNWVKRYEVLGMFQAVVPGGEVSDKPHSMRCIRPREVQMARKNPVVMDTSNALLEWRSQLFSYHQGERRDIPTNTLLSDMLQSVTLFTHSRQCPLTSRRFALGSWATIKAESRQPCRTYVRFADDSTGEQVAIGFEQVVDAIVFSCKIPDRLVDSTLSGENLRACRTAYFRDLVINDSILDSRCDRFTRDWLGQIYLGYILQSAILENTGIEEAARSFAWVSTGQVEAVLKSMFRVLELQESEDSYISGREKSSRTIHASILGLLDVSEMQIRNRLMELSRCLWEEPDEGCRTWLRSRIRVTLGGAILQSCYLVAPDYQASELHLDIDGGPVVERSTIDLSKEDVICISESSGGGNGVIEEIAERYCADPIRFLSLVEVSLGLSSLEAVDQELTRVLHLLQDTDSPDRVSPLKDAFLRVRQSTDHGELARASSDLMDTLRDNNIFVSHEVMTSLNARILRVGTSADTDKLLHTLINYWDKWERLLGVEIDARVFAYLSSVNDGLRERVSRILSHIAGSRVADQSDIYSTIYSLLWPRGNTIRERVLESYNPFCVLPASDPRLFRDELIQRMSLLSIRDPDFDEHANVTLATDGSLYVYSEKEDRKALKEVLLKLLASPVEAEFLYLYPHVSSTRLHGRGLIVNLSISEIIR